MLAASLHFVNITLHFPDLQGETEVFCANPISLLERSATYGWPDRSQN
jgi:hypothetical protein